MEFTEISGRGLNLPWLWQGLLADYFEQRNGPSGFLMDWASVDQLSDYRPLNKAPRRSDGIWRPNFEVTKHFVDF
jgi:hypothetical protein